MARKDDATKDNDYQGWDLMAGFRAARERQRLKNRTEKRPSAHANPQSIAAALAASIAASSEARRGARAYQALRCHGHARRARHKPALHLPQGAEKRQ